MKKLMTVLLAAALVLTAVFAFTACGDAEDAPGTANAGSTSAAEDKTPAGTAETLGDGSVFPAALSSAAAYPIPDLTYTTWTLSGGMADGKEMEEADLEKLLATVGGTLEFSFYENGEVDLDRADGTALDIVFSDLNSAYYAVMTDVEGTAVIIISPKSDSEIALYLTQIEVG